VGGNALKPGNGWRMSFWLRRAPGPSTANPIVRLRARISAGFARRIVGGRTNHWGRSRCASPPRIFGENPDGLGDDWPISYDDLAPYYDKVESYIGVSNKGKHSERSGWHLSAPPQPRCNEILAKKACDKLGVLCIPSRLAVLTRPLNGRPACTTVANAAVLPAGLELQFQPGDDSGGAKNRALHAAHQRHGPRDSGCERRSRRRRFLHRQGDQVGETRPCQDRHGRGERVRVCPFALEFPVGSVSRWNANSSGVVGRYLMDSVGSDGMGHFPQMEKIPPTITTESAGSTCNAMVEIEPQKRLSPRLSHRDVGGREMPGVGMFHDLCDQEEGYGLSLKQICRKRYGTYIGFAGRGEMIQRRQFLRD